MKWSNTWSYFSTIVQLTITKNERIWMRKDLGMEWRRIRMMKISERFMRSCRIVKLQRCVHFLNGACRSSWFCFLSVNWSLSVSSRLLFLTHVYVVLLSLINVFLWLSFCLPLSLLISLSHSLFLFLFLSLSLSLSPFSYASFFCLISLFLYFCSSLSLFLCIASYQY